MRRVAGFLLTTLIAGPAVATEVAIDADAETPGMITVTAERDAGYQVKTTGTATRTDTPLIDVPQTVDVLSRERLDDQAILSLGDALRYVPGTFAAQGEGHRDQIVIRGNSSTADFFVDGVRDDAQYFRDFYNIERLEILKGPNALTFGRGGGGGVINRVTRTPQEDRLFGEAVGQADTFGAWRLSGDINAPISGPFAVRLDGFYENGRNHRQVYELERWGVNPSFGFDLGGRGTAIIAYEHVADDRVVDRGVPSDGRGLAAGVKRFPLRGFTNTFFGDRDLNRSRFNADVLTFAADYRLSDSLTVRNRSRYADYDKLYRNLFPASEVTNAGSFGVEAYQDGSRRQNFFTQTDLVWKTDLAGTHHTILAGFEIGRQVTRADRFQGFFSATANTQRVNATLADPFAAPGPVFFRGGRGVTGFRQNRTVADIAAGFVQDQIEIGRYVQVIAGVRYDNFALTLDDYANGTGFRRTDNLWSPRFGLVLKPLPSLSLYGSYTRSYLPQSGDQFSSLDASLAALKPERFDNYEVGAKWDVTPDLFLTLAAYRLDRANTRATDPNNAANIVLTGAQRSEGIEASLTGKVTRAWQVSAGFAVQDAEIRSTTTAAPAGRKVPLVPRTQLSLWSRYDFTDRLGLGVGVVHQDRSFATISNAVILPAWTRVDAAAYIGLTRRLELQVNVENIGNIGYFPTAHTDNNITTGLPRTARFTLRSRF